MRTGDRATCGRAAGRSRDVRRISMTRSARGSTEAASIRAVRCKLSGARIPWRKSGFSKLRPNDRNRATMMDKRKLGGTGFDVAPLAFGGNVFDWTADEAMSFRLLDA